MKKILLAMAMIVSVFSISKGTTTISAGAGSSITKEGDKLVFAPKFKIAADHVIPVAEFGDNIELLVGGGVDVKMNYPKITPAEKVLHFDMSPYATAQFAFKYNSEIKLRSGVKAGVGLGMDYDSKKASKKVSFKPQIPVGVILGVDYKHFTFNIEGGTIMTFSPFKANYEVGANIGLSF